jgi:excisionase family DNA binding protein
MENLSSARTSGDGTEAIEALEKATKIVAKMIVKAITQELLNHERIARTDGGTIATFSTSVGKAYDQERGLVFSVREAAELMGISRNLLYSLIHTGQIPCVKWGKRILIPRIALLKMLGEVGT